MNSRDKLSIATMMVNNGHVKHANWMTSGAQLGMKALKAIPRIAGGAAKSLPEVGRYAAMDWAPKAGPMLKNWAQGTLGGLGNNIAKFGNEASTFGKGWQNTGEAGLKAINEGLGGKWNAMTPGARRMGSTLYTGGMTAGGMNLPGAMLFGGGALGVAAGALDGSAQRAGATQAVQGVAQGIDSSFRNMDMPTKLRMAMGLFTNPEEVSGAFNGQILAAARQRGLGV